MLNVTILKNSSILLLILFTSFGYAQKEKPSVKKKEALKTEAKNFVRKGNKLYNQGNYVAAENAYKEAIALNPDYDKANYNFGNTQFLQNKIKEAKEQYDLVAKTTKDPFIKADTEHNLGNVAMKDKKYAEAVEAYKEALRNNPNDDETRYNLALAQKLLKEQQKKNDKNKDKDDKDKKDKNKKDKDKKDKDKKDDKKNQKDKDKKDDKNKDKNKKDDKKDGDKDKKKDDKKDDGKGKNDKDKKEKQQPKPQQSKLSPEQVKQLLEAMNKEENKTQKKMNAKKARGRKVKQDKDW